MGALIMNSCRRRQRHGFSHHEFEIKSIDDINEKDKRIQVVCLSETHRV